ncbi:isoprenylcysteine carboxylmethyltransferase family protein [Phyllobacterium phragmitis]|uniref:Isoprenylcysteine carboxylmethyltransferase family protein n=1 Tax=Phyllobacterium phragmitis TaxID=2670329 RepID=A0A2S9IU23_9HYPH|nr:isoprenylcysteine carboxylmethyltransferase family protein [Phyllobacterium phragmitis]PRD44025.1 isoprenylcysteine carboxylmethyltransferase family protein [Phyllobacterium phragmitis]
MTDIQAVQSYLAQVQSRRKVMIWCISLCFAPVILFTAATFKLGSWQRDLVEGAGSILLFVAILGRAWCTLYIGGRKTVVLVNSGPYSITRNPLYFFSFVAAAGLGAQTGSISIAIFMALLGYVIFLPVVFREEAALSSAHGQSYDAYRRAVPRFLPRPALWRDIDSVAVDPRILRRTIADGMIFVLLALLVRALMYWKQSLPDLPQVILY